MSSVYEAYKPLRNFLRGCHLATTLGDVWVLSNHVRNGSPALLPGMPPYSVREFVHLWDLPTIAREIILHANPSGTRRLASQRAWATVINAIRAIQDVGAQERVEPEDGLQELHRMSHRQFPWQQRNDLVSLVRYLKIFGAPEVAPILEAHTGFSIREYFFLGMAMSGHLLKTFGVNAHQDFTAFGISPDQSHKLLMKFAISAADFRALVASTQKFDGSWEYAWNQLEATPLIGLDVNHPHHLHCPVPDLLLRRFSYGLYYDLVKAPGFNSAFGQSFQNYIGEVLAKVFADSSYQLHAERPYVVGKDVHHGADWILSGDEANLFIECKTKRLIQPAKFSVGGTDLEGEIRIIAEAVVQLYKNILEAQEGKSNWVPNGLPVFPLVVTLEDWFLFGPMPQALLETSVATQMAAANLDAGLLETMPYAIASARELERFANVVKEVGIWPFFTGKRAEKHKLWMWEEYARDCFPGPRRWNAQTLFPEAWTQVISADILAKMGLPAR